MAPSAGFFLQDPSSYQRFLGEAHHHTTPIVGQMDATMEIGNVG